MFLVNPTTNLYCNNLCCKNVYCKNLFCKNVLCTNVYCKRRGGGLRNESMGKSQFAMTIGAITSNQIQHNQLNLSYKYGSSLPMRCVPQKRVKRIFNKFYTGRTVTPLHKRINGHIESYTAVVKSIAEDSETELDTNRHWTVT